jgi:hypothetical protein
LPAEISDIAYQNKAVVYDLLMKVSADVMLTIAADPEHLGARIAITSVLHTWGSAIMHHPHVHMIVPGGGLSPDGSKWIAAKPKFLLPVLVLSALFRRRMLEALVAAHKAGKLQFFGEHANLADSTSTPSARSAAPRLYSPISPATPTALRSRTGACSEPTRTASPSSSKITGSMAPAVTRR